MVLLEFSISPLDQGASLGDEVSRALDIIDRSGLPYRLNPMGTVIEGEWDEVMNVVRDCYEEMRRRSDRISIAMKVDYRAGDGSRLDAKVARVEATLGRKLRT